MRQLGHKYKDDRTTQFGENIAKLKSIADGILNKRESILSIDTKRLKQVHRYAKMLDEDFYKISLLYELICVRDKELFLDETEYSNDDINVMINSLCSN